jgi:hypothetical protein
MTTLTTKMTITNETEVAAAMEERVRRFREDAMTKGWAENETCDSCANEKGTVIYEGTEKAIARGCKRRVRLLCQPCCDAMRTAEEEEE